MAILIYLHVAHSLQSVVLNGRRNISARAASLSDDPTMLPVCGVVGDVVIIDARILHARGAMCLSIAETLALPLVLASTVVLALI